MNEWIKKWTEMNQLKKMRWNGWTGTNVLNWNERTEMKIWMNEWMNESNWIKSMKWMKSKNDMQGRKEGMKEGMSEMNGMKGMNGIN